MNTEGYGETIQFVVNPDDRRTRLTDIKLYYLINSADILMHEGSDDEKTLLLRLSLLTEEEGRITSQLIENMQIHKNLMGWHHTKISSRLLQSIFQSGSTNSSITLNFHLTCLNCVYNAFPSEVTKHNVPFLRINGRRRRRRNSSGSCTGRCCKRERIVDFQALGWDWVLSPRQYVANYCSGTCHNPNPAERTHMTSDSQIVNSMLQYLDSGAVSTCCVPRNEESLTMLTISEEGALRVSHNVIKTIHSCKCT